MRHARNTTINAAWKLVLATVGVGTLLAACGGQPGAGEQTPAYAVAGDSGSFDISDPSAWVPVAASGSSVSVVQASGHDSGAAASLQINYQVAAGGYAALEHQFAQAVDWSATSAINLWVDGQGGGQTFLVQIYDAGGERWEGRFTVGFSGWQQVTIPFGSLKAAAWQPTEATVNGAQDFAGVTGLALIPSEGPGTGTVAVDTLGLGAGSVPGAASTAASGLVGATGVNGTIIPLYSDPNDGSWDQVISAKQAHPSVPVLAVVNPNNGPGAAVEASYTNGIAKLTAAGVKVIGYVHTSWGARPVGELQNEMNAYRTWYPGVTGIFLDEMANVAGHESYYSALSGLAKAGGFDFTIGNPGADTAESYLGSVDVILIYENGGLPPLPEIAGWHASHARSNFGVIPYGVSALDAAFVAAARPTVGYVYLQSSGMPNPWGSVPAYLSDLLGALQ
jgi:hypothetical protein